MEAAAHWWSSLTHGGMLLMPQKLTSPVTDELADLGGQTEYELRRRLLADDSRRSAVNLVEFLLREVAGWPAEWVDTTAIQAQEYKTTLGEKVRPVLVLTPVVTVQPAQAGQTVYRLPVFHEDRPGQLGVGRGKRVIAKALEWQRHFKVPLALVTNGRQLRLQYAGADFEAWCEWDFSLWFSDGKTTDQVEAFRRLLNPQAHAAGSNGEPPLINIIHESRRGQSELSQNLGENIRRAVEILIRANHASIAEFEKQHSEAHRRQVYIAAVRMIMRCIVAFFAEARELLPRDHEVYHESYSVFALYERLKQEDEESRGNHKSAWPRLLALFNLIATGSAHEGLSLLAYGGGLFLNDGDDKVLAAALDIFQNAAAVQVVSDEVVFQILRKISEADVYVRQGRSARKTTVPVDFSDLSTEYIGILYEGLLDYELKKANDLMVFLKVGDTPALPLSRLETMLNDDPKALVKLMEKAKTKAAPATDGDDEAADDEDAEGDGEGTEEENEETIEIEAELPQETKDFQRIVTWTIGYRSLTKDGKKKARSPFKSDEEAAKDAANLIDLENLINTGDYYLVRWGGTRKGSGSFYTRPQLAGPITRHTLKPLLYDEAGARTPEEILSIKACDPACGSGSFMISALRTITAALVESLDRHGWVREENDKLTFEAQGKPEWFAELMQSLPQALTTVEESREQLQARLKRIVVERCIYGVDLDPLAVELARLALWIETMDRSLPFEFLDHKIKCGNSLVGTWFDQFRHYPIAAWKRPRLDGDENWKKKKLYIHHKPGTNRNALIEGLKEAVPEISNLIQSKYQGQFSFAVQGTYANAVHDDIWKKLQEIHDIPIHLITERSEIYRNRIVDDADFQKLKEQFDIWCALWFWPSDNLDKAPMPSEVGAITDEARAILQILKAEMRFFHWELEFPDVFNLQSKGFSVILGNPPWDTMQPNSKEYFSEIDPLYRGYGNVEARKKQLEFFTNSQQIESDWMAYNDKFKDYTHFIKGAQHAFGDGEAAFSISLASNRQTNEGLHTQWTEERRKDKAFYSEFAPYRLQTGGKVYTYRAFLELATVLAKIGGRIGFLVPSGVYSDQGSAPLRKYLLERNEWELLYSWENRDGIFDIHRSFKFCALIVQKRTGITRSVKAAFMRRRPEELENPAAFTIDYPMAQVLQFSPNNWSFIELSSDRDLEILQKIYSNSVLLGDKTSPDSWHIEYQQGDFNMTSDSDLFPPVETWAKQGYAPDEYGHWLKGKWQKALAGSAPKPGHIRSRDGAQMMAIADVEDVALPFLEGRMLNHFDYSEKGWVSGKGRTAEWRDIPWEKKTLESQYLIGIVDTFAAKTFLNDPAIAYMRIGSGTNSRTVYASYLDIYPAGDSVFFYKPKENKEFTALCVTALINSFVFDSVIRKKLGGLNLSDFVMSEGPLIGKDKAARIFRIAARLNLWGNLSYFKYSFLKKEDIPCNSIALTLGERLRLRAILDSVVAMLFGLTTDEFHYLLKDCDRPVELTTNNAFTRELNPKGFWRVDKDKPPELRHTVLSLVAFAELEKLCQQHGDEKGIEAFLDLNDGDGWPLPETLRLADYGLGHDERAKEHQPVAKALGPRFYDWQLAKSPEESWRECEIHAKNLEALFAKFKPAAATPVTTAPASAVTSSSKGRKKTDPNQMTFGGDDA